MYSHTKRIGSVGRFGVRTGKKIREEMRKIEDDAKNNVCPNCGKKVSRRAVGVWECKFCKNVFAGGSYFPVSKKTTLVEE